MKKQLQYVLTLFLLLLIPHVNFGQAPRLGTTSGFALFTAVGAFNNEGATTTVTGDVGTNVGAFNAFPPGILVGAKHVADPASAQAAIDVDIAYSDLSAVTCNQVISTTLGNGQILTPDVYCLGGAATLNGDLILDGRGDPNALFIIKINGALSTSTFSNVILTNGANICNVYWQINGQFELGDFSVFRGTIVANGAIILLEGSTLEGRGLTREGEISLHTNIVTLAGVQPIASIITADGPTTFCAGGSVTLSGNNREGTWSNGETGSSILVTTSGDFFVTNTNGCGSATSNRITVTVNPAPVCSITGNSSFCPGQSTQLCAPTGTNYTYKWSTGETTSCINVSVAGTYSVTITNANGCESTCSKTVTAATAPSCTITGNNSFTTGSNTSLCGPDGASTYKWSTGATTQCITVTTAGTYSLTVTNANGCESTCSKTVTETPLPNVPSSCIITGNSTFCKGSTVTLSAPEGCCKTAYEWSTGATTRSITVSTAGTYSLIFTNGSGVKSTCTKTVTETAAPSCLISGSSTICEGSTMSLSAPSGTGYTYKWSNGATTRSITISMAGTYSVSVTNASGCKSTCSKTVTPSTSCAIIGYSMICPGQSIVLYAPSGTGYKYKWSTGATTRSITISKVGTYSVSVTNASGCIKTCAKTVTSGVSCAISGNSKICPGQSTPLSAPSGTGYKYKWSTGATTRSITVSKAGTYSVSVTNASGCMSTCSKIVTEITSPTSTITGSSAFCKGGSTSLCAPSGTGYTYKWNTGSTSRCITVKSAGTYSVTVTKSGCVASTSSKTVTEKPTPTCSITGNLYPNTGATTMLCAPSGTGYTYKWSNGATTRCITVEKGGYYTVKVTNSVGCSSSCTVCVTYPYSSARKTTVGDDTKVSGISVNAFPNPFSNKTTIEFQNNDSDSHVLIDIYGVNGNSWTKLFNSEATKGKLYKIEVNSDGLTSGVYIYRIITGKQVITKKLILVK